MIHLHRRAGFAASWAEIERDLADGPAASVDRLLSGKARAKVSPADFETMAGIIGDAACASNDAGRLKAWWLYRMLLSPDPLRRAAHALVAQPFRHQQSQGEGPRLHARAERAVPQHGRSPFGELLAAVVKQPAMLVWLDADIERAGHPNENLARE